MINEEFRFYYEFDYRCKFYLCKFCIEIKTRGNPLFYQIKSVFFVDKMQKYDFRHPI